MKLTIDSRPQHDFVNYYTEILTKSGCFTDIIRKEIPEYTQIMKLQEEVYDFKMARRRGKIKHCHGRMSLVKIDNKIVIIDTQFDDNISLRYFQLGLLNVIKPDLFIKYNNRYQPLKDYMTCPFKVWVMFPCGFTLVDKFKWVPGNTTNVMASGRHSLSVMKRREWFKKAESIGFATLVGCPQEEYLKHLAKSNWGISLSLKEDKNTREYEFVSNNLPLALNYKPFYDEIPFNPMEHYFLMENVNDLDKLLTVDPIPYHEKSKWLWGNYFRPDKATQQLLNWLK